MSIEFRGHRIPGTHGVVVAAMPNLNVRRRYYWGLFGESEVTGAPKGRVLTVSIWLHGGYVTRTGLERYIDNSLLPLIKAHGHLVEKDRYGTRLTYKGVTFTGFQRLPFAYRKDADPIRDYAGTVDGGWVQSGTLWFYQVKHVFGKND